MTNAYSILGFRLTLKKIIYAITSVLQILFILFKSEYLIKALGQVLLGSAPEEKVDNRYVVV